MKINRLFILALVAMATGCSNSALEDKVAAFELLQAADNSKIEILSLKETGVIKGSDSLATLFNRNLSDTGLKTEAMVSWTPDSMIAHYTKLLNYYKASIGAFEYSASTNVKPDVSQKYKDMAARYRKEKTDDSTRLQKLLFFNANKDSVLALRYEAHIRTKVPGSTSAPAEINKVIAVSKDKSMVLSSAPKVN